MAESIIKVIVTDEIKGTGQEVTTTTITSKEQVKKASPSKKKDGGDSNSAFAKSMIGAYNVAKTVSNQVLANVGTYTGDSHLQQQVNNFQTGIGLATMAVISPTAALISSAISIGSTIFQENHRRKMENISLSNARARNGYTDTASILTSRRH